MFKTKLKGNISRLERKLPLERFLPVVFLLFLLIFIFLSVITYMHINEYKKNVEWVNRSHETLSKTQRIGNFFLKIPLTCQNYFLTGDYKYLSSFYESENKVKIELKEMALDLSSNDPEKLLAGRLDSLSGELLAVFDSSISEYENLKFLQQSLLVTSSETEAKIDELMDVLKEIKNSENNLLYKRNSEVVSSSYSIQIFIIITSVFAFAVIGLALYTANKLIKRKNSAEELLQKSYEELESRVEERTVELKSVNENLLNEISSRIKIEHLLRESEQRFRDMADSAPVMIWMSGTDKLCNYFNKGWLDFTGRTIEQELGNGWIEGVHPEDLQKCLDTYILAFDKRNNFEMEYRLKNARGEFRWILDKGIPRFEGDEFTGYIGCAIDIQLRKQNEKYLNLQHAVSRTLTETSSVEETFSKVLKNICIALNWQFGVLWTIEPLKNKLVPKVSWSVDIVHHKEFNRIYDNEIENGTDLPGLVWKSGKSLWVSNLMKDLNFERKDLAYRLNWNSAFAIPVTNGAEIIAVVECFNSEFINTNHELLAVLEAVGRQIGIYLEKKKTEDVLKDSYSELENRVKDRTLELSSTMTKLLREIDYKEKIQNKLKLFAHAIRGIKDCVYITDLENRTLFVNSAFESVYGYFEQELLNKEIPVLFSKDISTEARNEIFTHTLRSGWRGELKNYRKDGSEFLVYLSTSVIRNDDGKTEALVGICQDISDIKASEELIIKRNMLLKLLNDIIIVTNKSFDLNHSTSYAISKVCQYTSWDVGHCYLLRQSDNKLTSFGGWNFDLDKKYSPFAEISDKLVFDKGEGLPGETLLSAKSVWININDKDESKYLRIKTAKELGLNTAILVPIMKQTEAIGVLEFFKKGEEPNDSEVLECISNIGIELGSMAERIEIIEHVKVSEKQFKAVADTANDAIITADSRGKIVYTNKSAEKIFGYSSIDLIGMDIGVLVPGIYIKGSKMEFEKAIEEKALKKHDKTFELSAVNKSNDEFPIEISLANWEINNEPYFTAMIKDITARKEIEVELIEKQKILLETQQIAKLGSWELNFQTGEQVWSDELFRICELGRKNGIPEKNQILELIHHDDREWVENKINEIAKNPGNTELNLRIVTARGTLKYLAMDILTELDDNSNVIRYYGSVQDVTDIMLVEEELRKTNEKLLNAHKELIHSEKLAALGRFSSGIAHEIRNPLANISALSQLLSKSQLDEKSKKHLKYILINADLADKIIKDLLNFAAPDEPVLRQEKIGEILENVLESVSPRCMESKVKTVKQISGNLPALYIDKVKLENALLNFISNALDAMEDGGELGLKALTDNINRCIKIVITDTGVGIPPENLDKILEPFFTTKKNGTGLGLGLAYQAILAHNGSVKINSSNGKGTMVDINLPFNNGKNTNNR